MNENYKVYKHIFPNNKIYIGITKQKLNRRWANGKGYKLCPLINKAIQKYGWDNIKHEILFIGLSKKEAEEKEIQLIKQFKSNNPKYGYNIENGGNTCGTHSEETKRKIGVKSKGNKRCLGRKISEEHIQKLYKGRMRKYKETGVYGYGGHKHTEEHKQYISEILKGKKRSEEFKIKNSQNKKGNKNCVGRIMSEETRKKISKANKGRKLTEQQKQFLSKNSKNKIKVNQYDLNGNFIKQYESLNQAEKETGIFSQNISKVCKGQQKFAKGYLWRYENDS